MLSDCVMPVSKALSTAMIPTRWTFAAFNPLNKGGEVVCERSHGFQHSIWMVVIVVFCLFFCLVGLLIGVAGVFLHKVNEY